ncbi:hypothetical protein SUGI_0312300 [Cryptomeria japonica]|nr:hypothetical protein SUGI_0312300 [Cryptomeria japonica]
MGKATNACVLLLLLLGVFLSVGYVGACGGELNNNYKGKCVIEKCNSTCIKDEKKAGGICDSTPTGIACFCSDC